MNSYDFGERVALLTGAASGIGKASMLLLKRGGAKVVSFDIAPCEDSDLSIVGNVTRSDELYDAVSRVSSQFGRLDILVCAAGIAPVARRVADIPDVEWRRAMDVNATGTFFANRSVIPAMLANGYGRIVNVSSIAGKEGNPHDLPYSASKASVLSITKSVGKDLAQTGILANCISPGVIETPMIETFTVEQRGYVISRMPMGRLGQAVEVARLIAFLASEDVSFTTGACFDISGGRATY